MVDLRNTESHTKRSILAPLQKNLARDHAASFYYINGLVRIKPPQGMIHPRLQFKPRRVAI
jgi:hypothetical protein